MTRRSPWSVLVRAAVLVALAGPVAAQDPSDVEGFDHAVGVGPFRVHTQGEPLGEERRRLLRRLGRLYDHYFGATPEGLRLLVLSDADHPEYEYDVYDQAERTIWILDAGGRWVEWTYAHELAHAYQYALDPEAYETEPSWTVEGWATHLATLRHLEVAPAEIEAYEREQARAVLENDVSFSEVFDDVYAFAWDRAYPVAHLAVDLLVQRAGCDALLRWWRANGPDREPRAVFEDVFGLTVEAFGARLEAYARHLADGGRLRLPPPTLSRPEGR